MWRKGLVAAVLILGGCADTANLLTPEKLHGWVLHSKAIHAGGYVAETVTWPYMDKGDCERGAAQIEAMFLEWGSKRVFVRCEPGGKGI